MSVQVICVASSSGIPIFSRKRGNVENLPFSVMGSLSGVHMFTKSQAITLLNTLTEDYCVVWKEYFQSILLIGISSGCTKEVLDKLLLSILDATILAVGIEEVKSLKNIEKIKRDLRIVYPVIDRLLESLDCGENNSKNCSDLISLAETILCSENHLIKVVLDAYTECISSVYTCVLIHGKIAVATEEWWELHPEELKLLSFLATSDITSNTKDVPVFLPYKSPNTAYRLITCTLVSEVHVCCLAGQSHCLDDVERSATQCFKTSLEILSSAVQSYPRNFPETLQIDVGILGLLLINKKRGKYVISSSPSSTSKKRTASNSHRLDILRTFFYRSVLPFMYTNNECEERTKRECVLDENSGVASDNKKEHKSETKNVTKETYWCSEYHKCYATLTEENVLCVMYNSTIPTFAMKRIAEKVLKAILSDKFLCW